MESIGFVEVKTLPRIIEIARTCLPAKAGYTDLFLLAALLSIQFAYTSLLLVQFV